MAKPVKKFGHVDIRKSRNGQYRVRNYAGNGEQLSLSEMYTTRAMAIKNIICQIKLHAGFEVRVHEPGSKTHPWFYLTKEGDVSYKE